jgi:hypothetical protein
MLLNLKEKLTGVAVTDRRITSKKYFLKVWERVILLYLVLLCWWHFECRLIALLILVYILIKDTL